MAAGAALLLVAGAGAAYAYWTSQGSGSGTAATAAGGSVVINQTSPITGLIPGVAQALSGTFDNPTSSAVHIAGVTATVASVSPATCTVDNFVINGISGPSEVSAGPGTGQGTWSGLSIQLANMTVNQDACKSATVTIAYTTNDGFNSSCE